MKKFIEEWWDSSGPDTLYGVLAVAGVMFLFAVVIGLWVAWLIPEDMPITVAFKALTLPTGMLLLSTTIFYLTEYKSDD